MPESFLTWKHTEAPLRDTATNENACSPFHPPSFAIHKAINRAQIVTLTTAYPTQYALFAFSIPTDRKTCGRHDSMRCFHPRQNKIDYENLFTRCPPKPRFKTLIF